MGMPATQDRRWTVAQVHALPDDPRQRYEVVDGELLVSPSPRLLHQVIARAITRALEDYLQVHPFGYVFNGPGEVISGDYSAVQPDIFVVPLDDGRLPDTWSAAQPPQFVVEVLSPSTARHDRVVKRRLYQRLGAEYWIIDPESRMVERWLPGATEAEMCDGAVSWHAPLAGAPFTIVLRDLMRAALREP